MKRFLLLMIGIWVLTACARLPTINPLVDASGAPSAMCEVPFPVGNWQLLHKVEAQFSGGKKSVLMGITDIFPQSKKVHIAIMTVEGLVLFEAEYDRELVVHRGISPFDSQEFARGLVDDIRLIFFRPKGRQTGVGRLQTGAMVCRHEDEGGRMIDTVINTTGSWELNLYDRHHRLRRRVRSLPLERSAASLPPVLELTSRGMRAYRLKMTLVKATRIR